MRPSDHSDSRDAALYVLLSLVLTVAIAGAAIGFTPDMRHFHPARSLPQATAPR